VYLDTVAEYLAESRVLLQDLVFPYRYSDAELVSNLNMGILESRRYRPDFFPSSDVDVPSYSAALTSAAVGIDPQYRVAFIYYIAGQAQLRDEENTQDSRAGTFLKKFASLLGSSA
jgi:hypothetical protein